jgi:AcrR family transcriptional regulator
VKAVSIQQRRARERAERHQMIIETARELAESEGWDAVTIRRLASRIEYSQPVLYSHFEGRDAIVRAVAVQGFGELAGTLRAARTAQREPAKALRAVADAYLDFAHARPALYDAMFVQRVDLPFGTGQGPPELHAAFVEILSALTPLSGGRDVETLGEVLWSALHGLASLTRGRRIRPANHQARLELLLRQLLC